MVKDTILKPQIDPRSRPSAADQVYEELLRQILSLELEPGAKLSEVEVAKTMDVSRQPVRDAFYRLSKLGFLSIRPQRATVVTLISSAEVMQARFIRAALEVETARRAATELSDEDIAALEDILERQREAADKGDRPLFHELDDLFHHQICTRANLGFAWELIAENKGHMDRVRMLSLSFAADDVYQDHKKIVNALKSRDPEQAANAMREHLSRIIRQIGRIRDSNRNLFGDE